MDEYLVNGGWSNWKDWSDCDKCGGGGERTRHRSCDNPPPAFGGANCTGEFSQVQQCNDFLCKYNIVKDSISVNEYLKYTLIAF